MVQLIFTRIDATCAGHVAGLQQVLESAPGYYRMLQGHGPDADEARREVTDVPDGFPIERKYIYLIHSDADAIGCLDLLNGYPDPATAFLGLLLFAETFQGRGHGVEALQFAERTAVGWGCTRIRIAVIDANERALGFWKHCGFIERERRGSARYASPLVILDKPLTDQRREATR